MGIERYQRHCKFHRLGTIRPELLWEDGGWITYEEYVFNEKYNSRYYIGIKVD